MKALYAPCDSFWPDGLLGSLMGFRLANRTASLLALYGKVGIVFHRRCQQEDRQPTASSLCLRKNLLRAERFRSESSARCVPASPAHCSGIIDLRIRFAHLHRLRLGRSKQIDREPFRLVTVEPSVVVARVQDDGHTRMNPLYRFVRLRGHNGEQLEPMALCIFKSR